MRQKTPIYRGKLCSKCRSGKHPFLDYLGCPLAEADTDN